MAKVDGIVEDILEDKRTSIQTLERILAQVVRMLQVMCDWELTHGDMSFSNMGYRIDMGQGIHFMLLDFGWSRDDGCNPQNELIALIARSINSENLRKRWLGERLLTLYRNNYEDVPKELRHDKAYWHQKFLGTFDFAQK
jgi:tRNA A-37 threonylcarbamoyl transferase component Bud32